MVSKAAVVKPRSAPLPDRMFLKSGDLARFLELDPGTITRLARTGVLPGAINIAGHWRFRRADIVQFLEEKGVL
jgi:hypothetical protein